MTLVTLVPNNLRLLLLPSAEANGGDTSMAECPPTPVLRFGTPVKKYGADKRGGRTKQQVLPSTPSLTAACSLSV